MPDIDVEAALRKYNFYHTIDLGNGLRTAGFPGIDIPQRIILEELEREDLTNKRVLDIGCRDGFFSFAAERLGAAEIVAVDNDLSQGATEFLIPYFKSKVRMRQLNVYELKDEASFDFVIFCGVLYHLRFPALALSRIAAVMRPGAKAFIETAVMMSHPEFPLIYSPAPADSPYDPTSVTFFNHAALSAALASLGFEDVTCRKTFGVRKFSTPGGGIEIGRSIYTCRRAAAAVDERLNRYWFSNHSLHSTQFNNIAFLDFWQERRESGREPARTQEESPAAIDSRTVRDAAEAVDLVAKKYELAGDKNRAERLFRVAADLELASPELQACWGGPFNGQTGRQAIILDAIKLLKPIAILETGTFRGISAEWLAQNYRGPIHSCEKERLYFLQAQARLSRVDNVDLWLGDSRRFLKEVLKTLSTAEPILVYLDAHWELDLPLREELASIFERHSNAVVVIDDFRVPDDPGYGWDDYGLHGAIELDLIEGVIPADARLFFPRLPSKDETGARRGCCIVASKFAGILEECSLIRGDTLERWLAVQQATARTGGEERGAARCNVDGAGSPNRDVIRALERHVEELSADILRLTSDRAAQLKVIERLDARQQDLAARLRSSEADRDARLEVIERLDAERQALDARLQSSEAAHASRLDAIAQLDAQRQELEARFQSSEADRKARLGVIERLDAQRQELEARLQSSDADRAARLDVIERLDAQRQELEARLHSAEADRAARLEVIERLDAQVTELMQDLNTVRSKLAAAGREIESRNGLRGSLVHVGKLAVQRLLKRRL